jgi:hypothetical protein
VVPRPPLLSSALPVQLPRMPLWRRGRLILTPLARIDYAINEAPNLLRPRIPPCLAKVFKYFQQHGITPDHMSADAGLDYADGLPHLVFTAAEMPVNNCTACVMVATSAFSPRSSYHHHRDRPYL